ncbi:dNA repair protein RadC [Firmicutes bacterium CAG:582]|nr:dNA repair protein RadC [Firmicutes bacterium CAG:582]
MLIKDLPECEKPRERMLEYGVENLSNVDLLSIILRNGVKDISVKEVAINILNNVESINDLSSLGVRELSNIKGVGPVKAITLLASIELGKRVSIKEAKANMSLSNKEKIHEVFKKFFINENQEKFLAIFLDNKKCLINYKILFIGTNNASIAHPREVFMEAIKANASAVVVMHNHPSGNVLPSEEDKNITEKLIQSGHMLGIPLLDHIITNGEEYYSFYDEFKAIF